MIRGYFGGPSPWRRALVAGTFTFPSLGSRRLDVELVIDTGADRTILSPGAILIRGVLRAGAPSEGLLVPTKVRI